MEIKNNLAQLDPYTKTQLQKTSGLPGKTNIAQQTVSAGETGDRVSLSPEAKLLTETLSSALNAPDMRQSKVEELKASIASGTYSTDSKAIAAKLLNEEPGLFRS